MILKIFIVGEKSVDKLSVAKRLCEKNDDLSIAPKFTSDHLLSDIEYNDHLYYMDNAEVDLSYKNNAFLCIDTNGYISTGVTLDSFYNNDVFFLEIAEFNSISDHILFSHDSLVIWLDCKKNRKDDEEDTATICHFIERTQSLLTMYFLDEDTEHIVDTILEYLSSSIEDRQKILDENS